MSASSSASQAHSDIMSLDAAAICGQCALFPLPVESVIRHNLPDAIQSCKGSLCEGYLFGTSNIELRVGGFDSIRSRSRPAPEYHINTHLLDRKLFYSLQEQLKMIVAEYTDTHAHDGYVRIFEFAVLILRMVEQAVAHLPQYHLLEQQAHHEGYNAQEVPDWNDVINNKMGVDPSTIPNTAKGILGLSPQKICEDYMSDYRVIHFESILRSDLTRQFYERQNELREHLYNQPLSALTKHLPNELKHQINKGSRTEWVKKEEAVEYLVTPKVTFHGTGTYTVPSIVQYGFLKPGDKHPKTGIPLPVRCGSTYGRGIYSSPDPSFALMYSGHEARLNENTIPGLKLIVCATIMARSVTMYRQDDWRDQSSPYPNADSHVANDMKEYIVFNNAQILPCYVLHLDWGWVSDIPSFVRARITSKPRPRVVGQEDTFASGGERHLFPGDRQRLKEERLAQARKFFAYGFGPVSGKNIRIEAIADIDDDEEDYGQYQEQRLDNVGKVDIWGWRPEGASPLDMYAQERKAKTRAKYSKVVTSSDEDSDS